MCMGGNNKAQKAAQAQEAERAARISQNVGDINNAYAGREGQYTDFMAALRGNYGRELNRQQGEAGRQLKFGLAKQGLTGGSAAVDANANFARESQEGSLQAERAVQTAGANLRSADENSRTQLISLAQSGNDIGNAGANAASALQANAGAARTQNAAQALGDLFGGTLDTYRKSQEAAQFRRGVGSVYGKPWSPA